MSLMALEYITTRDLQNSSGQTTGKIRIVKLAEQSEALVDYTCPNCGFGEKRKEAYCEPFVTGSGVNKKFFVRCGKCRHEIKLLKLKKEIKEK